MSEEEEEFDPIAFDQAIKALSSANKVAEIKKAARDIAGSDVKICYSTIARHKHELFFITKSGVNVNVRCALMSKLTDILAYDGVTVDATIEPQYASVTPIEDVRNFLREYGNYLKSEHTEDAREGSSMGSPFVDDEKKSDAQVLKSLALMPGAPEASQKRHKHKSTSDDSGSVLSAGSSPDTISPPGKKQ